MLFSNFFHQTSHFPHPPYPQCANPLKPSSSPDLPLRHCWGSARHDVKLPCCRSDNSELCSVFFLEGCKWDCAPTAHGHSHLISALLTSFYFLPLWYLLPTKPHVPKSWAQDLPLGHPKVIQYHTFSCKEQHQKVPQTTTSTSLVTTWIGETR